jgi:transcriptional regulator with XRE-family HTH domain
MRYKVEKITRARAIKGWTQAQLARAIGKDPSTISKIENGEVEGNPPTMKAIADVLNLPMEELLVEESEAKTA